LIVSSEDEMRIEEKTNVAFDTGKSSIESYLMTESNFYSDLHLKFGMLRTSPEFVDYIRDTCTLVPPLNIHFWTNIQVKY
jgi:hypothetical protein